MALNVTFPGDDWFQFGNLPVRHTFLAPDAAYPTNGYPVTGQTFGGASAGGFLVANNGLRGVNTVARNTAALPYSLELNATTGNIQFFTAGAEVANGTNLSALLFVVFAYLAGE